MHVKIKVNLECRFGMVHVENHVKKDIILSTKYTQTFTLMTEFTCIIPPLKEHFPRKNSRRFKFSN